MQRSVTQTDYSLDDQSHLAATQLGIIPRTEESTDLWKVISFCRKLVLSERFIGTLSVVKMMLCKSHFL